MFSGDGFRKLGTLICPVPGDANFDHLVEGAAVGFLYIKSCTVLHTRVYDTEDVTKLISVLIH